MDPPACNSDLLWIIRVISGFSCISFIPLLLLRGGGPPKEYLLLGGGGGGLYLSAT